ncbi:dienelactone hydrolase family protein [Mucilaginibacter sp.]|uniref:dienelactone hydrolase family protein n=1 Tax=Mucilaginibacter sp. TaxID=1882438 RepID=UPI003AFF8317
MSGLQNLVQLQVADGTTMQAYTSIPVHGKSPFPGLILFQEAFGVNHHIRKLADRFADEGYLVIAPELFHRSGPAGVTIDYTDFQSAMPHMQAITVPNLELDIKAAWDWLQSNSQVTHEHIVATGYCLGGRVSFLANTMLPFKAVASYYGAGIVPDLVKRASSLNAPHLFFWGGKDEHIPKEQPQIINEELTKVGKNFINVAFSDAEHGFFCDERASFNASAAELAWGLTLEFFIQKMKV